MIKTVLKISLLTIYTIYTYSRLDEIGNKIKEIKENVIRNGLEKSIKKDV